MANQPATVDLKVKREVSDVKSRGFRSLINVDEAIQRFLGEVRFKTLSLEEVPLDEGVGRILAEDIRSEVNVPPFNRSAMDGYAVRSVDTVGASAENPIILKVTGKSEIGEYSPVKIGRFEAVEVSTGAPIPEGADAVVMLEYTRRLSEDRVEIYRQLTPYENVNRLGEDVREGEIILSKGMIIQPQDVGVLAAIGKKHIRVFRKVRIAVLSVGDELVDVGEDLSPGKVLDVNRYTIKASIRNMGCEPIDLGIARDDIEDIRFRAGRGLENADIIVISGGASVGSKDLSIEALKGLGDVTIAAHGVAMRPGMPTALMAVNGKPLILTPGSPAAALISFRTFVKPLLSRMFRMKGEFLGGWRIKARMGRKVPSTIGFRTFLRVSIRRGDDAYLADPITIRGSGIISSLVKADGIVVIPEDREGLEEGEEVTVELIRPLNLE